MRRALLACAAAGLLAAQAPAPATAPAPAAPAAQPPATGAVVAESGPLKVTAADVRRLIDQADPSVRAQVRKDPAALAQLVRSEVLRQELLDEAKAKKWDQTPDVAARLATTRDGVIVNTYLASLTMPPPDYPADAEIEQTYEANKPKFVIPRQYHLAQIFLAVPAGAAKSVDDETLKKMRDLRTQLSKPKADFAEAAKKSDDAASAAKGGDIGFLREDNLLGPVRDAVAGLSDGQLSEPVRAADGWHLFKLIGTRPAAAAPLADVRESIVRALRQARMQQNEKALADDLQKKQPIQINEIELAHAVPQ